MTASSNTEASFPSGEDAILQATGLTKDFRGFRAVDTVDLSVRRGSIHALIGPNGAGKTTCFNLLTKFLQPTSGRIMFDGTDITRATPPDIAKLGLVRSFQISAVFSNLTVMENVRVPLQRRHGGYLNFWLSDRRLRLLDDEAERLIADVGLTEFRDTPASELSYGRKRALEIATTLALDPKMLLLDEPMAGMTHEDVGRMVALISSVAAQRTVLMVEHNLDVVSELADRITVLARGQVIAEGSYSTISADPQVVEAYIGTPETELVG